MSESTKFNYSIVRENSINNFIKDLLEDRIEFDYSKGIKEDKNEVFNAAMDLKAKIITYLANKEYHKLQENIFSCYLTLKIFGVIRPKLS